MAGAGAAAFLVAFIAFIAFTAFGMVKENELAIGNWIIGFLDCLSTGMKQLHYLDGGVTSYVRKSNAFPHLMLEFPNWKLSTLGIWAGDVALYQTNCG